MMPVISRIPMGPDMFSKGNNFIEKNILANSEILVFS